MSSPVGVLSYGLIALAAYVVYLLGKRHLQRRDLRYPPGPPGLPLLGNVQPPASPSWETYLAWSKQYGSDIIYLNPLGNDIIIVNTMKAARELLDKKSAIYSDRPVSGLTMLGELVGLNWTFALQPYGAEWRDGRKAFQRVFHPNTVSRFRPMEILQARKLLRRLLNTPQNFLAHTRLMTGSSSLGIAYGIQTQEENDPYIMRAEHTMDAVNASLTPGAFLVDLFPILKHVPEWVPGAGFQTKARQWRQSAVWTLNRPWEVVKEQINSDPSGGLESAAKTLIQEVVNDAKDPVYMERVVKAAAASIYIGGSDTTLSILESFYLAMVLNPDVQRKAQAYIDEICKDRLPDFDDYDSLPYIHAVVKECLRWHPVAALNVPHRVSEADVYNGYHIPGGSIVIVNSWALLHDPEVYADPLTFRPERFLTTDPATGKLTLDSNVRDPAEVVFGFGRRICPGRFMAHESMWAAVVSILATFDVGKPLGENGKEITPPEAYCDGFVSRPLPFECRITPRSERHATWIREAEERL